MGKGCEVAGCTNVARSRGKGKRGRLCNTHHRERYPRNRSYVWRQKRKSLFNTYGIGQYEKQQISEQQGGCCAICGRVRPLVVDHNHITGQVRGLLCSQCNSAIGLFSECEESIRRAADYVAEHRAKQTG
jgi:hypothetical protein